MLKLPLLALPVVFLLCGCDAAGVGDPYANCKRASEKILACRAPMLSGDALEMQVDKLLNITKDGAQSSNYSDKQIRELCKEQLEAFSTCR